MSDKSRVVEFPKTWKRKLDRVRKKTPFRFDPLPSLLTEYWLPDLDLPELRCLIYICRRTWGFRKEWDAIAVEQFCSGVKDRSGKHVDRGVGFKPTYVKDALKRLESRGLISVTHRRNKPNLYRLTIRPLVTQTDQQDNPASHTG